MTEAYGMIDAYDAARHFCIAPVTLRVWQSRGLLKSVGKCGRRNVYRMADVAELEAKMIPARRRFTHDKDILSR